MNAALASEPLSFFGSRVLIRRAGQSGGSTRQEALAEYSRKEGWLKTLRVLVSWQSNLQGLRDEELTPPTPIASAHARWIARESLDRTKIPAPLRVLPSGDGGIVFEWRFGEEHRMLEIHSLGTAEDILFRGDRIISRRNLSIPSSAQYSLGA